MSISAPIWLKTIADRVEAHLAAFLGDEQSRWSRLDSELGEPIGELLRLVSAGGKRLRPAFCELAFVGVGGNEGSKSLLEAQTALELLHASALFHDDIIDGSTLRRGEPTSHLRFEDKHRDSSWAGETRRFGEGAAILVGDLAFVYADQMMSNQNQLTKRIWDEMRVEVNIGQYLDLIGTAKRERKLDKAERVSRFKSGKYTVERPLHLGASIFAPERADELFEQLSAIGLPLGDAFQMRDDILGAFGDQPSSRTGKPIGDDLREGKPTPLLALAFERATSSQRDVLGRVGDPNLSSENILEIQQVIIESGALGVLESRIGLLVDQSIAAIDASSLSKTATERLIELAEFVVARNI
ncbi:MAG: polyprenyl synthetase family protein [Actinomycetota bacterium]